MLLSNLVMYFLILTTGATLHAHGVTQIDTAKQAAEALLPLEVKVRTCCLPWDSLELECSPCPYWPAHPPMPSQRQQSGGLLRSV
jgi:hypothetical protein